MTIPCDRQLIFLDFKGDIPRIIGSNVFHELIRVWSSKFDIGSSSCIYIFPVSVPVDLVIRTKTSFIKEDVPGHFAISPQTDPNLSLEQLTIY